MVLPSFSVALLTTLVTARSARCTVIATESRLFVGTLSAWSAAVMNALFRIVVPLVPALTVAFKLSVAVAAFARVPTVHNPVPDVELPWLGVLEPYVSPAGRRSVRRTFVALLGPLFRKVTV